MDLAALVLMGKLPSSQVAAGSLGDVWPPLSAQACIWELLLLFRFRALSDEALRVPAREVLIL